jgi:hypothetical protein
MREGGYLVARDLDILSFRFPGSGRLVPESGNTGRREVLVDSPDESLDIDRDEADMLIGEVKENALIRFGCCPPDHVPHLVDETVAPRESGHREAIVSEWSPSAPLRPAGSTGTA